MRDAFLLATLQLTTLLLTTLLPTCQVLKAQHAKNRVAVADLESETKIMIALQHRGIVRVQVTLTLTLDPHPHPHPRP